ncbi:hypothetical protein PspLS_05281 [Pyricularia sp. CBS 133598]|nr:hypothetical protein PspLS_05281 [Pyricularia sp. CBS 133598]
MPIALRLDDKNAPREVVAIPLTAAAFAPFGDVVQNPRPDIHPSSFTPAGHDAPHNPVAANQGFAIKYQHPTRPLNLYPQAPSREPGAAVVNVFVCAARKIDDAGFPIQVLERHPFTTQTFTPMSRDGSDVRYLVIVAPSVQAGAVDKGLPVPSSSGSSWTHPGRGLPDLGRLQAFIATGSQAVTYGAGTWHAPMVALGADGTSVDFFVTQFANGVGVEDCQEVVYVHDDKSREASALQQAVSVHLPSKPPGLWTPRNGGARL